MELKTNRCMKARYDGPACCHCSRGVRRGEMIVRLTESGQWAHASCEAHRPEPDNDWPFLDNFGPWCD